MDRQKTQEEIESILDDTFYIISTIRDPEFPQTLGDLNVIQRQNLHFKQVQISSGQKRNEMYLGIIQIIWVPTVPHCHLASQIGLSIITKLQQELPNYDEYKIEILVKEGTHQDKSQLDKQINDKERVCAAQENEHLMQFIQNLISYE
ncbi:hypothetical protein ABPG72_013946 [Tetrahymena utriculariae]